MTQQTFNGRIYSGDLYCRKYGTDEGFVLLGNLTELKTKSDVEKKELKGTGKDNYGQAIDSIVIPKPTELELGFNSFDKHALARALMGELHEKSASAQTIDETQVKASKTGFIKLKHEDIDPANFELKKAKGKAVIDKSKYELKATLGMVRFIDNADITEGEELLYTGKTLGRNCIEIEAGSLNDLVLELRLDGKDRITGKEGFLHIPHAVLSAKGDLNWLDDNWWKAGLSGTAVKDHASYVMKFTEFD